MTLAKIWEKLEHISEVWRSETANEQKLDLADLDGLLGELDDMDVDPSAGSERIDELRGRIEILMDEIDISLGIEPAPIAGFADYDVQASDVENPGSGDQVAGRGNEP